MAKKKAAYDPWSAEPIETRGDASVSDKAEKPESVVHTIAVGQLRAFIERIERLEDEKKTIADDIKDVYGELKGTGFDAKAVKTIIRLRKLDENERREEDAILQLYKDALGMA